MSIDLTDETIDKLADKIFTKSTDFAKSESEKQLRNTKLLLQYYRLLENHLDVDLPELDDDTKLSKYELSLYSLLGYRARSKEMVIFIKEILSRYKNICMNGSIEQQRRYEVIVSLYVAEPQITRSVLCERFSVDESTIRRDVRKAIEELTVMIFGIDGINDMSK